MRVLGGVRKNLENFLGVRNFFDKLLGVRKNLETLLFGEGYEKFQI